MTTQPWEFAGRFYTFRREPGQVVIVRDDGMMGFDIYPTHAGYHAYTPSFPNIAEAKQALMGERPSTYYHRLVFAATAYAAAKIAEEEDKAK